MIDSHLHLAHYDPDVIERWREAGVEAVVAVATDLHSSYRTLECKARYPDFIHAAIGWHPEQPLPRQEELGELLSLLRSVRPLLSAVGEVGLPHYALAELGEGVLHGYEELLGVFADAAARLDLPVVLHAVHDKAETALEIVQKHNVKKAQFHWLKASPAVLSRIVNAGYYVSVTPDVCYRDRDQRLAQAVPLPQLLIETDGPWPHEGPFARRETTPLLLPEVAKKVAELHGVSEAFFTRQHRANVCALYGDLTKS